MTPEEKQLKELLWDYKEAYERKKGKLTPATREIFLTYLFDTLNTLRHYAVESALLHPYVRQRIIDTRTMLYLLKTTEHLGRFDA